MAMGYLYQRKQRDGTMGGPWWAKYYVSGRPVRESTGTVKKTEAERFLKTREGRVALGMSVQPRLDRLRYEELASDLRRHYELTGERQLKEADDRLKPLARFFTGKRASLIDGVVAERYVLSRQQHGLGNGTINRELSMLGRVLRFAYENGKLLRLPVIRLLKEPPPRRGFFEPEVYLAVRRHLRADLQIAVALEYTLGWRCQSEVLRLELRQLDLEAGTIRLDPGRTKNTEGRIIYLTPELKVALITQVERVRALERRLGEIIPFLFPHFTGPHEGERLKDFRKAWGTAPLA
jgi:integrase